MIFMEIISSPYFIIGGGLFLLFIVLNVNSISKHFKKSEVKKTKEKKKTNENKAEAEPVSKNNDDEDEKMSYENFINTVLSKVEEQSTNAEDFFVAKNKEDDLNEKVLEFLNSEENDLSFLDNFFTSDDNLASNKQFDEKYLDSVYGIEEFDYSVQDIDNVEEYHYDEDENYVPKYSYKKIFSKFSNLTKEQKIWLVSNLLKF